MGLFSGTCDYGSSPVNLYNSTVYGFEYGIGSNQTWQSWEGSTPQIVDNEAFCGHFSLYVGGWGPVVGVSVHLLMPSGICRYPRGRPLLSTIPLPALFCKQNLIICLSLLSLAYSCIPLHSFATFRVSMTRYPHLCLAYKLPFGSPMSIAIDVKDFGWRSINMKLSSGTFPFLANFAEYSSDFIIDDDQYVYT